MPDRKYGEEILACIMLRENAQVSEEDIIKYVKDGLSRYKAPRYVRFVESFPLTASGKIQKYKISKRVIEELNLQDTAVIGTA